MSDGKPIGPWKLGPHFAHLVHGEEVLAVDVADDFWSNGLQQLPDGRLLSFFRTEKAWPTWEMHPRGDEFILQLAGTMVLICELPEGVRRVRLETGHFAIVPRGVWHTADVEEAGEALYITLGEGTEIRQR